MHIKFLAHTEYATVTEDSNQLFKHVITPVDLDAIPHATRDEFPNSAYEQAIHHAIDPEDLDTIVGMFDTYPEAQVELAKQHIWRATRA